MATTVKTFQIVKRARKYFQATLPKGYKAQILINDISDSLVAGQEITLEVNDISTRSSYGTTLRYEPIAHVAADMSQFKEAQKWLGFAESDIANGLEYSNAIGSALQSCKGISQLADRLESLKAGIEANKIRNAERKQQREIEKAAAQAAHQERRNNRKLYPLSALPAFNTPVRSGSRVVVFESTGTEFEINEDHPSYCGSHLLGYEGEFGCYCYYREATPVEIAELESAQQHREAAKQTQQEKENELTTIKNYIIENGELPEGQHSPEGERLLDTQDLYGGGEWFVIGNSHIWYVRNNGMDGDDWSRNNVITAGAGAIGWRIPLTTELEARLRKI